MAITPPTPIVISLSMSSEILLSIFQLTVDSHPLNTHTIGHDPHFTLDGTSLMSPSRRPNYPLIPHSTRFLKIKALMGVCTRWRSIIVKDAHLWSHIYCDTRLGLHDLSQWFTISSQSNFHVSIDTTLGRQNHYKTVPICKKPRSALKNANFLPGVLPLLKRFISRVKTLTILSICSSETRVIINFLENIASANLLQNLSIRCLHTDCLPFLPHDDDSGLLHPTLPFQGNHPNLLQVQLYNIPMSWFHPKVITLTTTLHTANLHSSLAIHYITSTSKFSCLESLSVGPSWMSGEINFLEIPTLVRLDVEFNTIEDASTFFLNMFLPKLRTLSLRLNVTNSSSCLVQAATPQSNGLTIFQTVSTLTVRKMEATQYALNKFFSSLPHVKHIIFPFASSKTSKSILRLLLANTNKVVTTPGHPLLCPMLSHLCISDLKDANLARLIDSRHRSGYGSMDVTDYTTN